MQIGLGIFRIVQCTYGELGFAVSEGLSQFLGWATSVSSESIVLSVGFAAVIGVVFGFYPAWKAAQLDPIAARRADRSARGSA